MSLINRRSILRIILVFNSLDNFKLMVSRYNWFLSIVFLTAAFSVLINPPLYITALFFSLGLMLLATTKSIGRHFQGGVKNAVILASLIVVCLFIPQVETNMANFKNPTDRLENIRSI